MGGDGLHDGLVATAGIQNAASQHHDAHEHHNAAQGIGDGHAAETSDSGEQHHGHAEQAQADHVGIAGHRFEELRAAHELSHHGGGEEQHDDQRRQVRQGVGAVAGSDDVHDGHGVQLAGDESHLLAEDAVEQHEGGHLHHGHVHPTETDVPSLAGAAYKGAHRPVGGDGGHGQHEAAQGPVADEVAVHEGAPGGSSTAAHDDGGDKGDEQKACQRGQRRQRLKAVGRYERREIEVIEAEVEIIHGMPPRRSRHRRPG